MNRSLMSWLLLLLLALGFAGGSTSAQEEKKGKPAESADLYTVPDTKDPEVLVTYLRKLQNFEPTTKRQAREYDEKAPQASRSAAELILKLVPDIKEPNHRLAKFVLLGNEIQSLNGAEPSTILKTGKNVVDYLAKAETIGDDEIGLLTMLADTVENQAPDEVGVKLLPQIASLLAKSEHKEIKAQAKMLEGVVRRLQLPGNEMKLSGTTYQGKPFELSSLKGKVVLVDFWATWCGFCIKEFPHVKELHAAYKDRGFEVVGVSLDESREDLDAFLKEDKLPWIVLHEEKLGGQNPAAAEYGISGLPTVALIGKDGKVITFDARGEQLDEHLKKLLGPVKP